MRAVVVALLVLLPSICLALDPSRLEGEIQKFEVEDQAHPPAKNALVLVGSSTIKRWSTSEEDLSPHSTIRRGIAGATTEDVDYALERIVLAYEPKSVLLYIGDNDLASGKSAQYVADQNAKIAKRIVTRYPDAKVYFVSSKPSPARWNKWDRYVQTNQLMKAHAATDARYAYVDIASPLLKAGLPNPKYFVADDLHLSAAGYAVWTATIKAALDAAPKRPNPPLNFEAVP